MMDQIRGFIDQLKERLQQFAQEQQESQWFISLKEKYEELPPTGQTIAKLGTLFFILVFLLILPLMNLMESMDLASRFDRQRKAIKDLLAVQREAANAPVIASPPPITSLKSQFDNVIAQSGIEGGQILESNTTNPSNFPAVKESGLIYKLQRITVKQIYDLVFAFESSSPSVKVINLMIDALEEDPHYYTATFNIVSFAPNIVASTPGGSIADAIKKRKGSRK